MELYKIINDRLSVLKITGNSRNRIMNDYENGDISASCIETSKYDDPEIYLTVNHGEYLNRLESGTRKKYIKLDYSKDYPSIKIVWESDEFVPSYVVYPTTEIKPETYKTLGMDVITIDEKEKYRNDNMYDEFYEDVIEPKKYTSHIISKYGRFIKLSNRVENEECQYSDEESEEEIENELEYLECDDYD